MPVLTPFSPWASWQAVNPDGALYEFEAEPVAEELPGVCANAAGTDYVFGEPVPAWEAPEDTWFRCIGHVPAPEDWRKTKKTIRR